MIITTLELKFVDIDTNRARAQAEPPQNKMQKKQESESKLNKVNVLKAQGSLVRICNALHHLYQSEGSVV